MNTSLVEVCDDTECQELETFLVERIYEFMRKRLATLTESFWAVGCRARPAKSSRRSMATRGEGGAAWLLICGCASRSAAEELLRVGVELFWQVEVGKSA